jgi:uncharacterized membrane protein
MMSRKNSTSRATRRVVLRPSNWACISRQRSHVSPNIATAIFVAFVALLFIRDGRLRPMTSPAAWLPLVWLAILGSRPVLSWLTGGIRYAGAEDYLECSPMDAGIFPALVMVGAARLKGRLFDGEHSSYLLSCFYFVGVVCCWSEAMSHKISPIWFILLLALVTHKHTRQTSARSVGAPTLRGT